MAKLLFTMVPANDLWLPTRPVPIARALADRGHEVALFNPSPAPAKLISEAGLTNRPGHSHACRGFSNGHQIEHDGLLGAAVLEKGFLAHPRNILASELGGF